MYGTLNISTSALVANRIRLETHAANIANKDAILNAQGEYEPFQRRSVLLAAGDPDGGSEMGVHVAAIELDQNPPLLRYEPGSQFANADGYVGYPNINIVSEQVNAMEATRSYEANIAVIEATKSMMSVALQILG